jgi:beta-glucanase (GH16 family)
MQGFIKSSKLLMIISLGIALFLAEGVHAQKPAGVLAKENYKLVWADEFSNEGKPDAAKWMYDIGNGNDGWGNQELEYYTDRPENVACHDGLLTITARKEQYKGSNYTSTRMKTLGKYSFTHGILEIKAKLPGGKGSWPALWMLGESFPTDGWPGCGEIDMMEYAGKDVDLIHGSIHNTSSYGNTVNTKTAIYKNAETEFHIYSVEWTDKEIRFMVDGDNYYTYKPAVYNKDTWPFNDPFFIIMNVAIGGGFAGSFVDDSRFPKYMVIDYVRVYQLSE